MYEIAKNPHDDLWYVIGCVGETELATLTYVPVSDGFKTKKAAQAHLEMQRTVDAAAKQGVADCC